MKKLLAKILLLIKRYKFTIITYIIFVILTIVGANVYLDSIIEDSFNQIKDDISYGVFSNSSTFGVRDKSYTIVSYELGKIPEIGQFADSSSYKQKYGNIDTYYLANGGWDITVYEKLGDRVIVKSLEPYAVGISSTSFWKPSPEDLFRRLYNNIIEDEDFNVNLNNDNKVEKLQNLKTDFHNLQYNYFGDNWSGELFWYSSGDNKMYTKISHIGAYNISQNFTKINTYRTLIPIFSILIGIVFFGLVKKLSKRKGGKSKNKSRFRFGITLNKSSEEIHQVENDDVALLLQKINPSNFMVPYDAEKVKIANDLYSALLNANGNKTIIAMIREKAISDLEIEI